MADYTQALGHGLGFAAELIQGRTREGFDSLSDIASGRVVSATLSTANTRVKHGLGREPSGWFVVDIDANDTVYRSGELSNNFIGLATSTGAASVKVFVF